MSIRILLLNGPNLNLLGQRDTEMYGAQTLEALERAVAEHAASLGAEVLNVQSNVEGELINALQKPLNICEGLQNRSVERYKLQHNLSHITVTNSQHPHYLQVLFRSS